MKQIHHKTKHENSCKQSFLFARAPLPIDRIDSIQGINLQCLRRPHTPANILFFHPLGKSGFLHFHHQCGTTGSSRPIIHSRATMYAIVKQIRGKERIPNVGKLTRNEQIGRVFLLLHTIKRRLCKRTPRTTHYFCSSFMWY